MATKPKFKPFEKSSKDKDAKGAKPGDKKDAGPDKGKSDKFPAFLKKK